MAGFFGLFDYSRPGKGVSKDEPQKPRFLHFWELFFRKFWKLIQLDLLFIAFCLPLVTVGPAVAGFTYVLRNMATERPVFLFSDFWDGFKNNLLQSFIYSLMLLAASVVISVSWGFYQANLGLSQFMIIPLALCGMLALLAVFTSFYIPLMIVTLDLKLFAIIKNAAILSLVCLKSNLLTLFFAALILAASVLASLLFPFAAFLLVCIVPAMLGFMICYNSFPGVKRYVIDPFIARNPAGEPVAEAVFEDGQL
jgi:uncharacterized membrane protein YesL